MSIVGTSTQSPRFSPGDLPGLALWLDGADPLGTGSRPAGGAAVTTWIDKSGNRNHATAGGTPTYLSGGGITFNGSNAYYTNTNFPFNLSQRSIFFVFKMNSLVLYAGVLPFIPTTGSDDNQTTGMSVELNNGFLRFWANNGGYKSDVSATLSNVNLINDNMDVRAGSSFLNGTQMTSSTSTFTQGTTRGYAIGARWIAGINTTYSFPGVVYEVLYYSSPLTAGQRQQVEGYLARKWGITSMIGHPYRFGGPGTIPSSISGLRLWIDAADPTAYTLSGSNVTGVRDKSPSNVTLSNVSGYVLSNTFNGGYPSFVSPSNTRTQRLGQNSGFTIGMNFTVFWVAQGVGFLCDNVVAGNNRHFIWTPGDAWRTTTATTTIPSTTLGIYSTVLGTTEFYLNGTAQSATTNDPSVTSIGLTLGNAWTLTDSWIGSICEMLYYDGTLSAANRILLEGYLANKWGLQGRLSGPITSYAGAIIPMRPFTPRDIDNLAVWLDAADRSTLTLSGSNVTQWGDKSGNGNHAVAAGSATPTLLSNFMSGLPGVAGATNTYMSNTSLSLNLATRTVFLVCSTYSLTSPTLGLAQLGTVPSGTPHGVNGLNTAVYQNQESPGGQFGWIFRYFSGGGYYKAWNAPGVSGSNLTPFGIYGEVVNNQVLYPYVNGSNVGNVSFSAVPTTATGYYIGARYDSESVQFGYPVTVAEFLVFSNALTDSQRQQIESYLAQKWGLRGSMGGSAHPFRYGPALVTPTSFSGCTAWYDGADATAVILSGGVLSSWRDKSGNNRHTGGSATATWSSNGVRFEGTSAASVTIPYSSNYSIFLVATNTEVRDSYFFARENFGGSRMPTFIQGFGTSTRLEWFENDNRATLAESPTSTFLVSVDHVQGGTITGFYNGTQAFSIAQTVTYAGNNWDILAGSSGGDNRYKGTMKELIFFGSNVSTAQRQQIEGYLAWKWGLSSSLPGVSSNYGRIGRALTPVFLPTQISGAMLWLDATDSGTVIRSGSNIVQWRDKAGTYTMDSVPSGFVFPVSGVAINGLSTVGFTQGAQAIKQAQLIDGIKNFFWVRRERSNPGGYTFYFGGDGTYDFHTGDQGQYAHGGFAPQGVRDASLTRFQSGSVTTGTMVNTVLPNAGTINLLSVSNMTGSTRLNGLTYDRGDGFRCMTCDWGELLLYSNALSTADVKRVEGYLAWKWGIQSYLPTGHPFKVVKP